jgi:putative endonuclease
MTVDRALALAKKARARARGASAEAIAARFLEARGLHILGRNVRVARLEIDLVAREGDVICIVEVRARERGAYGSPFRSITWKKARRVRAAGHALWRARFRGDPSVARMRFDVVAITFHGDAEVVVEHARAAF